MLRRVDTRLLALPVLMGHPSILEVPKLDTCLTSNTAFSFEQRLRHKALCRAVIMAVSPGPEGAAGTSLTPSLPAGEQRRAPRCRPLAAGPSLSAGTCCSFLLRRLAYLNVLQLLF